MYLQDSFTYRFEPEHAEEEGERGKAGELLQDDKTPGLGKWAGKCRRKALEELTGEKQFSCKVCGQGISNRSGLISHINGRHGKSMDVAKEIAAKGGA